MSIKTDELQTVNVPALTDTLLLANSAGGTAQLSMAQAAAFFGAEMVKAGNPVGAALSSKAALSAQETVERTSPANMEEITLDAADLPDFITALPRLLTKYYVINVSGTLEENLNILDFYGPGGIRIVSETFGDCTFCAPVRIANCSITVQIWNISFQQKPDWTASEIEDFLRIRNSSYVRVLGGEFSGLDQTITAADCEDSSVVLIEQCKIHGFKEAVFAGRCSKVFVIGSDDCFHDNTNGAYAWYGGSVFLIAPDLLGSSANIKYGGMIVKGDGTLL